MSETQETVIAEGEKESKAEKDFSSKVFPLKDISGKSFTFYLSYGAFNWSEGTNIPPGVRDLPSDFSKRFIRKGHYRATSKEKFLFCEGVLYAEIDGDELEISEFSEEEITRLLEKGVCVEKRASDLEKMLSSEEFLRNSTREGHVECNLDRLLSKVTNIKRTEEVIEQFAEHYGLDLEETLAGVIEGKDFVFGNPENRSYAVFFVKSNYLLTYEEKGGQVFVSTYDFLRNIYAKRKSSDRLEDPLTDRDPNAPLNNNFDTPLYVTKFHCEDRMQGITLYARIRGFLDKHANPNKIREEIRKDMQHHLDSDRGELPNFSAFESYVINNGYAEVEKHEILILVSGQRRSQR